MMHVGGYLEYRGGCSVPWGIPSFEFEYRGRYHDACGGYHEYRGVFSTVGYSNNKRLSPHGTEHPPQYS